MVKKIEPKIVKLNLYTLRNWNFPLELRKMKTANLNLGDFIRVQPNIGWEFVNVKRRYDDTGKLDIQFEDGETMFNVLPRILNNAIAPNN